VIDLNESTIVVGLPEHGKTTIARKEAKEHLLTYPTGLVLAHDPNGDIAPDLLATYDNTEQWRKAFHDWERKGGSEPFPRGASFSSCEASEVGKLAIEIGERHNRAKNVKRPIKYEQDEGASSDTSEPSYQGPQDRTIWTRRRHLGIAPLINVQVPTDLHAKFWRNATKIYIFAQAEDASRYVEEKLSLPKGTLDALTYRGVVQGDLKYKHVLWRQGRGLVTS
jgi:hypothetical protein